MLSPEKAIYITLKDFFDKTKMLIKEEKMKDCKLLFNDNYSENPYFALVYTKPSPKSDYIKVQMRDETELMQLLANNGIEFKYEPQMMELVINHNILDNISMKSSWKNFINDNFHNCPDLTQKYKKEEVENFSKKLDKNLKPKIESVKKMKI